MLATVITPRVILVLAVLLLAVAVAGATLSLTLAQSSNGVYDTDGDKLIEISYLEQLDALRYDPDGNGAADETSDAAAYALAFPVPSGSQVCVSGCDGYELSKSLDFEQASSYLPPPGSSTGTINTNWISTTTGNGWTPIVHTDADGNVTGYNAKFEGNKNTISNLYSKSPDSGTDIDRDTGLFGLLDSSADVKNLGLLEVSITGRYNDTGALAARNKGKITGSYASGSVVGKGDVGGLVGNNESTGTLTKSYTSGYVASGEDGVGGLVGDNFGSIIRSYSSSNVVSRKNFVGGLAGYSVGSITHSYATGKVEGGVDNQYGGGASVGGLLGKNLGTVTASYATGNASGKQDVGGLAGHNVGNITGSYATGSVSASQRHAGGLVGANSDNEQSTNKIQSSYATGSVSGGSYAGGLVGENDAKVENSYSIGAVTGTSNTGGLIGGLSEGGTGTVSASYWNTDTSGIADTGTDGEELKYGDGKTTGQLIAPTSATGIYANWDEDGDGGSVDFWHFGTAVQYPALKADLNNDGTATAAEFGSQRTGVHAPTITPTPTPVATPTSTPAPTTGIQSASATSITPSLSAEGNSATTLKLTISNHPSLWQYKQSTGASDTCQTGGNSKTSSVVVTGLAINTSYTYAAYDDPECQVLLATAAATSTLNPSLASSGVTADSAKITISGWKPGTDGSWYYKANLAPYASCSAATTTSAVDLSGLTGGTQYTFKAYSGSTCADADEIASGSFTTTSATSTPTPTPTPESSEVSGASDDGATSQTSTQAAIDLSVSSITVTEGGTASYTVKLNHEPYADVTVAMSLPTLGIVTANKYSLTFTSNNWDSAQTVTLSGTQDDDPYADNVQVKHTASNGGYQGVTANLAVTVDDDDDNGTLVASDPTTTTVLLTMSGYGDWNWWHQRAGWNECIGPVSTSSHRVTGILPNVSSSHIKAYSSSSCNSSDKIADSNNFATAWPTLTVSDTTYTSAKLTISDEWDLTKDGPWHYGTTGAWKWCSDPITTQSHTDTPLVKKKSYTYAAHADSDCGIGASPAVTFVAITDATLTASLASARSVHLTLGGDHTGNWWYQRAGWSECLGPMPTNLVWIHGLQPNASMYVNAYDTSLCEPNDKLAQSNRFSTTNPTMTASNVTGDSATLTLSTDWASHDGNWYYKADKGPHTSCSTAQTGNSASISGLNPTTEYTYTAYLDSGCNTWTDFATVDFTTGTVFSVSNLGQSSSGDHVIGKAWNGSQSIHYTHATSFTTGANANGYELKSVIADFGQKIGITDFSMIVSITENDNGVPGSTVVIANSNFSGPSQVNHQRATYTCSGSCDLSASTTYHLVFSATHGSYNSSFFKWRATSSDDQSGPAGWAIGNDVSRKTDSGDWTANASANAGKFKLSAEEK